MNKITKLAMAVCMATSVGAWAEQWVEVKRDDRLLKYMDGSTGKEATINFRAVGGPGNEGYVTAAGADCLTEVSSTIANLIRKDPAVRVDLQVLRRLRSVNTIEVHHQKGYSEDFLSGSTILVTYDVNSNGCDMMDAAQIKQKLHAYAVDALEREQKARKLDKKLDAICEGDACEAPEAEARH
ncbi:MAG: hypothetical protein JST16_00815 [Bdellovibrionales bacterium]|nr:hypothetical protein [Bdellovibrionales bacterium]